MQRVLFAAALTLMVGTAAAAQTPFVDRILTDLKANGYHSISVTRTWLGRYRIEAEGPNGEREIVVNARTGEVLRDFMELESDDDDDDDDEDSGGEDDDNGDDDNDDPDDDDDDDDSDDDEDDGESDD